LVRVRVRVRVSVRVWVRVRVGCFGVRLGWAIGGVEVPRALSQSL